MIKIHSLITFLALGATLPQSVTSAETFDGVAGFSQEELDHMNAVEALEENEEAAFDKEEVLDDEMHEHLSLADTDELDEAEGPALLGINEESDDEQQQEPPAESKRRRRRRRRRSSKGGPKPPSGGNAGKLAQLEGLVGKLLFRVTQLEGGAKKTKAFVGKAKSKIMNLEANVKELTELVNNGNNNDDDDNNNNNDNDNGNDDNNGDNDNDGNDDNGNDDNEEPTKPTKPPAETTAPPKPNPEKPDGPEYRACINRKIRWTCRYTGKNGRPIYGRCGRGSGSNSGKLMCQMAVQHKACVDKKVTDKCSFKTGSSTYEGWCFMTGAASLTCRKPSSTEKACTEKKKEAKCEMKYGNGVTRQGRCKARGYRNPKPGGKTIEGHLYCHTYSPSWLACEGKDVEAKCSYCGKSIGCKTDGEKTKGSCQKRGSSTICLMDPKDRPHVKACAGKKEKEACKYPGRPTSLAECTKIGNTPYPICRLLPLSVVACKGLKRLATCEYKIGSREYTGRCDTYTVRGKAAGLTCKAVKRPNPVKPVKPAPSPGGSGKPISAKAWNLEPSASTGSRPGGNRPTSDASDPPDTRRRRRARHS